MSIADMKPCPKNVNLEFKWSRRQS